MMKESKPVVNIEGTVFLFDIDQMALIEKDHPENYIPFGLMKDLGTHYEFTYSRASKNFHFVKTEKTFFEMIDGGASGEKTSDPPIPVKIARIGTIDPQGMCARFGCTPDELLFKSDFEIIVDQKVFEQRLAGMPVTIEFPGKTFIVDVDNNFLKPLDGTGENISLNALRYDYYLEDDEVYHLFYNVKEGKVVDVLQDNASGNTEDRVVLEIPQLFVLDPIGCNLSLGWNERTGLLHHRPKLVHQAGIVPWSIYGVDQSIEKSLKSLDETGHWLPKPSGEVIDIAYEDCSKLTNKTGIMERELPTIAIEGTDFLVDVKNNELREKNDPTNKISLFDMRDLGNDNGYAFTYSPIERNIPSFQSSKTDVEVAIPEFVKLDPVGMSEKYGVPLELFPTKNDFDLMVDQEAFQKRMNGLLPTIDIAGHTFYVDIRMDMLRPKDDFLSEGIKFSKIGDYYVDEKSMYIIPYNPQKHEFHAMDMNTVTEIPKGIIVVSFPDETILDPIGCNRKYGFDEKYWLKEKNVKSEFKSGQVPWKETGIDEIIKENRKRMGLPLDTQQKSPTIKKGRKL